VFRKIFQDTSILLFSQVISKALAFFYTVFLAQTLGVSGFGIYTFAFSIFALISSISEFGISRYIMREVATGAKNVGLILTQVSVIRLVFVAISILIFYLSSLIFNFGGSKTQITLLILLGAFPQAIALSIDSVFIGLRKIKYSGIGLFIGSFATTIIGIVLLTQGYDLTGAVLAVVLAQVIYTLVLVIFSFQNGFSFIFKLDYDLIKKSLSGSLIYGILGVLGLLYFRIDAIFLSVIRGDYETGLYGAAYRFLEAVLFIPSAVNAVIFPIFAKLHTEGVEKVRRFYFKFLWLMFIFSIAVTALYILILPLIIQVFLPSFLPSIAAIQILSLTIPFMFAHVPATLLVTSSNKYLKQVLLFSVFTLIFNIALNLLLIPRYGFIGSSIVTVFSEAASFLIFYIFIQFKMFKK
jgi:O-antigen/teichoic acid export membrane protein